jgi:hypothetical protein
MRHPRHVDATVCLMWLALLLTTPPSRAQGVPHAQHVVVVIMENQNYNTTAVQPYTAGLRAAGATFTGAFGVMHPSQPNYIAFWAGQTLGVTDNYCPAPGSPFAVENLGHACEAAGLTWRAYVENLPAAGSPVCYASSDLYTRKHAPWTDFSNLDHNNERPFNDLATDLAAHALPNLAIVIPNNCHNSHNGGFGCEPSDADLWLSHYVPTILPELGPDGVFILTWDEDDYSLDNHILTVFAGPQVAAGITSSVRTTHYRVTRAICDMLALTPFALAANEAPITDIWTSSNTGAGGSGAPFHVGLPIPNPTSGEVDLRFVLPARVPVRVQMFDAAGRRIATVMNEELSAGLHSAHWNGLDDAGRPVHEGIYFARFNSPAGHATVRIAVIR